MMVIMIIIMMMMIVIIMISDFSFSSPSCNRVLFAIARARDDRYVCIAALFHGKYMSRIAGTKKYIVTSTVMWDTSHRT